MLEKVNECISQYAHFESYRQPPLEIHWFPHSKHVCSEHKASMIGDILLHKSLADLVQLCLDRQ